MSFRLRLNIRTHGQTQVDITAQSQIPTLTRSQVSSEVLQMSSKVLETPLKIRSVVGCFISYLMSFIVMFGFICFI